jgi:membrane protein
MEVIREVWRGWNAHRATLLAAGLAFFGALAASPLIVIISAATRDVAGKSLSARQVYDPIAAVVGPKAAGAVAQTVAHSPAARSGSVLLQTAALAFSFLACAGLFVQFRGVMDIMFGSPGPTSVRGGAGDLSYGFIATVVIGIVAALHGLGLRLVETLATTVQPTGKWTVEIVSVLILICLVPVAYRYLARDPVPWGAATMGAAVAVVTASLGTLVAWVYFTSGWATTLYGPAASMFVALLWLLIVGIGAVAGAETSFVWQRLERGHSRA